MQPGYSLYKPENALVTHGMQQSPDSHKWSSVPVKHHELSVHSQRQNYPSSLVQMVEHLESTNEPGDTFSEHHLELEIESLSSNEEEKAVLDNIFFLKR